MIDVNLQKEYAHYRGHMSQYKEVMDKEFLYIQEKILGEKVALPQAGYIDFFKGNTMRLNMVEYVCVV
jgi:hypothetical protein|nr:MAG TPA: hypothetical protein [Caudoviricetes sp.]